MILIYKVVTTQGCRTESFLRRWNRICRIAERQDMQDKFFILHILFHLLRKLIDAD